MHPQRRARRVRVGASFHLVQDFTSDKEKLVAALEKLDLTGSKFALDQVLQLAADAESSQNTVRFLRLISNIESLREQCRQLRSRGDPDLEILPPAGDAEIMEARAYAELSQSREMQVRRILAARFKAPLPGHCADI